VGTVYIGYSYTVLGITQVTVIDMFNLNSTIKYHCTRKTILRSGDLPTMSANITKYISRYHVFGIDIMVIDFTISITVG